MSSPGHFKTPSEHDRKRYLKIRTRISQAEQQAVEGLQELQVRISPLLYVKEQIQRALRHQWHFWNAEWVETSHQWKDSWG